MARRGGKSCWGEGAESDLAPVALLGECHENGISIKRYAPGWAMGVTPSLNVRPGVESRGFGAKRSRGIYE